MDRKDIKNDFRSLLHEYFEIGKEDRKLILEVIEHLEDVKGKEMTNKELAEKCKSVYQILRSKEIFVEFISILKEDNKLGAFANTTY